MNNFCKTWKQEGRMIKTTSFVTKFYSDFIKVAYKFFARTMEKFRHPCPRVSIFSEASSPPISILPSLSGTPTRPAWPRMRDLRSGVIASLLCLYILCWLPCEAPRCITHVEVISALQLWFLPTVFKGHCFSQENPINI